MERMRDSREHFTATARWHEKSWVTDANLRALLNFAYVHAASATGPVVADRVLGRAVAAVEAMPEAALFSSRKLL